MRTLLLAWRYVAYHKVKTAILIACITLTTYLPVVVHGLISRLERELTARAASTPLVIGAKGSRFDLTLGGPVDTTAGRVILELKTGRASSQHQDDLRFYALLETLVTGVPPLLVATFYVDAGRVHTEDVNELMLEAAVRRTIDGVKRLAALRNGDVEARRVPGPPCRWCGISGDCEPGLQWMQEQDEASGW